MEWRVPGVKRLVFPCNIGYLSRCGGPRRLARHELDWQIAPDYIAAAGVPGRAELYEYQ